MTRYDPRSTPVAEEFIEARRRRGRRARSFVTREQQVLDHATLELRRDAVDRAIAAARAQAEGRS